MEARLPNVIVYNNPGPEGSLNHPETYGMVEATLIIHQVKKEDVSSMDSELEIINMYGRER